MLSKALTIVLPLSESGLRDPAFIAETLAHIARFGLPGDLLHFSLRAEGVMKADEQILHNLARLREQGCRIVLSDFGHNLDVFSQLPGDLIDYLILSPELTANVHCNLMDEMMVSILQGHAQRMNIATLAGPVDQQGALTTLSTTAWMPSGAELSHQGNR